MGCAGEKLRERRGRIQQVLEVVEQEQRRPLREVRTQILLCTDRVRDARQHELGLAQS